MAFSYSEKFVSALLIILLASSLSLAHVVVLILFVTELRPEYRRTVLAITLQISRIELSNMFCSIDPTHLSSHTLFCSV